MLPSQGLFRSIPCPFFLAGLCERPHCSFRHCRSDIRIDRKLESETLDETPAAVPEPPSTPAKANEGIASPTVNDAASTASKEPVTLSTLTISNNSKSDAETTVKEENKRRLSLTKESDVTSSREVNRKRSRDSEPEDSGKRRRLSLEPDEMGQFVSKPKPSETSISELSSEGKKRGRHHKDELDLLVEEIERSGKSSEPRHKSKKKKHKHRRKSGDAIDISESSSKSCTNEKEKLKVEEEKRRKEEKDKDVNKHSKNNHSKHSDHKKRKDSKDSSSSSSPKDSKRLRKSSGSTDLTSSSKIHDNKSSHSHKSKESPSTASTPKSVERKRSKDSSSSPSEKSPQKQPEASKEALKSVHNNFDTGNRFRALAENLSEESTYSSDIFDESLNFNYPDASDSDDDPEMVARECLELFENYKPDTEAKPDQSVDTAEKKEESSDEGFCVVGKKRVAHPNAVARTSALPPPRRPPPTTSQALRETLYKRLEEQAKKSTNSLSNGFSSSSSTPRPAGKTRIAHVPNAGKLAQKPVLSSSSNSIKSNQNSTSSTPSKIASVTPGQPGSLTYSQTAAKGVKREAHKPTNLNSKQGPPSVFRDAINKTTKIPHNTRQQIVDKMYTEYYRILEDHHQAFEATVNRENELLNKCSTKQVYLSSGISIIAGLRKANRQDNGQNSGSNRIMSHAHILTGGSLESRNCSVRTTKRDDTLPQGNRLYNALTKYVLTESLLAENGYPRPHPSGEPGRAMAKARPGEENSMTLQRRYCDRCRKRYETTDEGEHIILEVCNYHWGRKYNVKAKGGRGARESTFSCCGSDDDKIGCVTAVCHVSKCPVPISSQKGFVEAVLEEGAEDLMGNDVWDIIGIDCEMVYTTHGNELARVTIVAVDGRVLYDEIVKPTHRVLDCNTRFSGITFEDMDRAKRNITEIQAIILTHLRPNTIIIGHSLESDLIALRLKHECVIDTTVLYPHRMGPPKKRALKNLSAEILKKVIQELETGHDSAEDAQIAVELVLAKLRADNVK